MIPPQRMVAQLSDKIVHNDKFIQYMFEMVEPHRVQFQAGQYLSIQVTDRGDRRSYSICSSPDIEHGFELLVDITPQGLGTQYLASLNPGDKMNVLGPLGVFTVPENSTEQALILLGTGSGIAPFRSMIFDQLQNKKDQRPIILYWGMRYVDQMFWEQDFQDLSEDFPNFQYHPVISKAVPEWPLCRGRVTDCLNIHQQPENAGYYICGNVPMFQDVAKILSERGIPQEHIHHEKFH